MTASAPTSITRDRRCALTWLFGFFAFFITVDIVLVSIAVSTQPGVVTDEAYEKGLAYNSAIAAAEKQDLLKWTGTTQIVSNEITFHLVDQHGGPVSGGVVTAILQPLAQQGPDHTYTLIETRPGFYTATTQSKGVWNAYFKAQTPKGLFEKRQRVVFK